MTDEVLQGFVAGSVGIAADYLPVPAVDIYGSLNMAVDCTADMMEPYNENPFDKDLCACRDDEGTCKACIASKWKIEYSYFVTRQWNCSRRDSQAAEIPKKPPAAVSKGHLHEIIAGVCVFVVIAVVMLLLYKFLAKRYGIECALWKSKMKETGILHVLCIDIGCTKEDASKLQFILENNLSTKIKFTRIIALPDTKIASKMSALWKNWKLSTPSTTENPLQRSSMCNDTTVCESKQKADDIFNILICFMVSSFSDEKLSEYICKLRANLPLTAQLHVQICAVTFADKLALVQSKTALKCYSLNQDKQDFVTAVKKAFSGHTKDKDVSVVYACGKTHSEFGAINGVKADKSSQNYVALPKSQTYSGRNVGDFPKTDKERELTNNCVPEIMYLGVAEPRRERYVSNDSGRGVSELSYKPGYSPEDRDGFWEETTTPLSALHSHQFLPTDQNGFIDKYPKQGTGCPSCNISFFPPDPSVISENDFDPNTTDLDAADDSVSYKECAVKPFSEKKCSSCQNGLTKPDANSMDSLMDKMAEINERSAIMMLQNASPGEVHSVWEEHV
ncbi:uncharacterized protein LOC128559272 [Mercenaria mercenaria]|uniref:uncharacterized protein LOC128559272 n=1 Tax=Mercenaria mercenaria TaxID=6596 RepID=UPI00234F43EC|nr:uncharacterized protein LOC128559272 [Mercenaria mercenaria]